MNTSFYIAKRYLFAKKSTNAINIISAISMTGVFVGSAALIIILSVFNGFEGTVLKMVNTFSPHLLITPVKGKTFDPGMAVFKTLKDSKKIYSYTEVLAENAVLKYRDKQAVGLVKGVSEDFLKSDKLKSIIIDGKFVINYGERPYLVLGAALQNYLMVNVADPFTPIQLYSPGKKSSLGSINPAADFTVLNIAVAGVYEVKEEYDNIAIVPLSFSRKLLNEAVKVSSIEINLKPGLVEDQVKAEIQKKLGADFLVQNRLEQNKALYNVLGSEKWMVYIILTFILIIAIFNIIGSLTMLVIEKVQDINVLSSLGAGKKLIRRIFLFEGMMITLAGCIGGLLAGFLFCLLQARYGWIKMGQSAIAKSDAYPIGLKWTDFLLVFITVTILSFIASALASNISVKKMNHLNQTL